MDIDIQKLSNEEEATFVVKGRFLISLFPSSEEGYDFCTFLLNKDDLVNSQFVESGIYSEPNTLYEGVNEAYISACMELENGQIPCDLDISDLFVVSARGSSATDFYELLEALESFGQETINGVLQKILFVIDGRSN